MPPELAQEQQRAIADAVSELNALAQQGLRLQYPVFFVPGWTGESAAAWLTPYTPANVATKTWMDKIFRNASQYAVYVNLTNESPQCRSFRDFGSIVRAKIGNRTPCDCVGHSMGGLDIAAAIALCVPPLLNVKQFITFGSPLRGTEWGDIGARLGRLLPHLRAQLQSLDPDQPFIQQLRSPAALARLLERVERLHCLYGTRDMAVRNSPKVNYQDIDPSWQGAPPATFKTKVRVVDISGAEHSKRRGITQDPRAVLWLVRILGRLPLPKVPMNHGYLYTRGQLP